jgi:4-amino-4-deoxy-L-arabinose transferase-like glycosyltransferase
LTRRRVALFVVITLAALQAFAFARLNPDRLVPGTDSEQYDLMARQLAAGTGLTLDAQPPLEPTLFREPGYPLLVAAAYRIDGFNLEPIVDLQALMVGLAAGFTALIGTRLFGHVAGLSAAVLFGLNSEVSHYAHWLLTEVPFVFLLTAVIALALRAQADQRRADFLSCGIGLGLTALVRVIAAGLIIPIGLALAFTSPRRQRSPRLALLVVGFAVILAPWVVRNVVLFNAPTISGRFGVNLLRRSARAAEPLSAYPDWLVASAWMAANPVSNLVYPISRFQWGPDYEDNLIWDFHVNEMVSYMRRYEPVCQPQPDPDDCYASIGMAFVRAYPVGYVAQSFFALVTLLFAPLPGPQALEHNALVWLGLIAGVALLVRRRLRAPHVLVLLTVGAYLAASILVDTQQRYLMPLLPLFSVLAAVPIAHVLRSAAMRLSQTQGQPSGAATQSRIS